MSDDAQLTLPEAAWPTRHVGPRPEPTILEAFQRFHNENPQVYVELVKLSRRLTARGTERIGIGMLFEVLRYRHALRTRGDVFQLNHNYRSYYARLIMLREPDLRGAFELRKLHGPGLPGT